MDHRSSRGVALQDPVRPVQPVLKELPVWVSEMNGVRSMLGAYCRKSGNF